MADKTILSLEIEDADKDISDGLITLQGRPDHVFRAWLHLSCKLADELKVDMGRMARLLPVLYEHQECITSPEKYRDKYRKE